jgi:hypothetical protein
LEEKSGRAIGVSSIYFNLAKVSHLDTDSDYCPKPHTPSLDNDITRFCCIIILRLQHLAFQQTIIPTGNHAYLTYQLDVIKCEHRYYLLDLAA